eukprot:2472147-Lingulodinium_polyedra.AAC.1
MPAVFVSCFDSTAVMSDHRCVVLRLTGEDRPRGRKERKEAQPVGWMMEDPDFAFEVDGKLGLNPGYEAPVGPKAWHCWTDGGAGWGRQGRRRKIVSAGWGFCIHNRGMHRPTSSSTVLHQDWGRVELDRA